MTSESAPQKKSPDHLIGQTLAARYLIEEKLGEGAMGAVYKARHVKVGRAFAVKVLHSRLLDDNKVAQRFEREAELAGRLSHANVIGVVDVGETPDGLRYMVMDFAEGEDLAGLLTEAPMTRERIIHLTRQLLEGLFHAHEAGLIHRDFKPENVIISKDDHGSEVPRIVDFGIAILREGGDSASSEGRLTTNGLVLGTPHYMAPEQAVADPIDHRIDLFALGIVIYEMLCGKLPFDGSGAEVARANLLLDPPAIAKRVPYLEVDPLLEAFSRMLMAKKRTQRPATARDAREILDLIDKDPEKAAAKLGVPFTASAREPAITQEQREQEVPAEDSADLPVQRADAPAQPAPSPRMLVTPTAMTEPLAWGQKPKRRKRALVIGGVLLLGGTLAIVAIKPGAKRPAEPDQKVVMTATQPVALPKPDPQPPIETPPPPHVDPVQPAEIDMPTETPTHHAPPPPPTTARKPIVAKADPPKQPIVPTETPAPPAPTPEQVSAMYGAVGREIAAVAQKHGKDAASDLWRRYRNIQIQEATATPTSRINTAQTLATLQQEAASKQ